MLRFRVLGASCFGLRFRVLRFRNYRYVNALLTSINLPAVGQNTLKAREREVGAAIETAARNSCLEGLQLEKDCRRTVDTEQVVKIGVSYDMSTQKRGKGHNIIV